MQRLTKARKIADANSMEKGNEMVNYMICECSKLTPKEYKRRYDWVVTYTGNYAMNWIQLY